MGHDVLIKDALVFLFAAGILVPILRVLKLPTVAGFILAGIALGPSGFGSYSDAHPVLAYITISDTEAAAPFAELGVIFLLFLLGLELSVEKLWALRRVVFGAGVAQAALSTLAIAWAAYLLGLSPTASLIVGFALSLSSTAIVMQLLIDQKRTTSPVGRTALGVLLFQDLLVAPILIFVGFSSLGHSDGLGVLLLESLIEGTIAFAAIFVIGRFLLRPAFRLAAASGGRDLLFAIVLLTVVGAAVITASAGLSIALGAFLAGLLVGATEFKHQTQVDLEPFKGLLLGLFFMTVGFGFDLSVIFGQWPIIAGGLISVLLIKAAVAWGATRLFAGGPAVATESASLLAPAGEFAFVILTAATLGGVIDATSATLVAAIAGLSMLLVPATWSLGRWLVQRSKNEVNFDESMIDFGDFTGHFVITGFGRVGRTVAHILEAEHVDFVALDTNPTTVARERARGRKLYLGDGAREEILSSVGIHGAEMVIITVDDADSAQRMVRACRHLRPDIKILARAQDVDHATLLSDAGASHVIPDAIEAGLQLAARALEDIGYDSEPARDLIAAERDAEYQRAYEKSRRD